MGREGPSSESLRKRRAGNEVRGQQQQFSYYNVSMAAGEEQQHTTPCGTRTNSDSTHTYKYIQKTPLQEYFSHHWTTEHIYIQT